MRAYDPVAIVERAYLPSSSVASWMSDIVNSVAAPFDHDGTGVVAYRLSAAGPENIGWRPAAGLTTTQDEVVNALRVDYETATPEVLHRLTESLRRPGVATASETFGELPSTMRELRSGLRDSTAVIVHPGDGPPLLFATIHREKSALGRETKALWQRIAVHLGAAARLAGRDDSFDSADVEVVVDDKGKVAHASEGAQNYEDHDRVRSTSDLLSSEIPSARTVLHLCSVRASWASLKQLMAQSSSVLI